MSIYVFACVLVMLLAVSDYILEHGNGGSRTDCIITGVLSFVLAPVFFYVLCKKYFQ